MSRSVCGRFKGWLLLGAIILLALGLGATQDAHARLTATQSLYVEGGGADGLIALGTLVLDLALADRWHATYLHDRGWRPGKWHTAHDLSVTRVLWRDTTATMGVRLKLPADEAPDPSAYVLFAWRWGGP